MSICHHRMQIYLLERLFSPLWVSSQHDHMGHPKEQNNMYSLQKWCWIKCMYIRSIVRPPHYFCSKPPFNSHMSIKVFHALVLLATITVDFPIICENISDLEIILSHAWAGVISATNWSRQRSCLVFFCSFMVFFSTTTWFHTTMTKPEMVQFGTSALFWTD